MTISVIAPEKALLKLNKHEYAAACYAVAMQAYPTGSPWPQAIFQDDLELPASQYFMAFDGTDLIGFLSVVGAADQLDVSNVAVLPAYQGQGIAGELFKQLIAAVNPQTALFLEVRVSNQVARHLYEQVGFVQISTRKNYYDAPQEDALLMRYDNPKED